MTNTETTKRPWYKMKRSWAAGFIALFFIAIASTPPPQDSASPVAVQADSSKDATPKEIEAPEPKSSLTSGQENALASAESYLDMSGMSKKSLEKQLAFEDYSKADAAYAASHVDADWGEEAVQAAEAYLDTTSMSKDGLIEQLLFEDFTQAQAEYAASKVY